MPNLLESNLDTLISKMVEAKYSPFMALSFLDLNNLVVPNFDKYNLGYFIMELESCMKTLD